MKNTTLRWAVGTALGVAAVLATYGLVYLPEASPPPSAQMSLTIPMATAPAAAPPVSEVRPPASESEVNILEQAERCLNTKLFNPLSGEIHGCKPGIPSPEVLAASKVRSEEDLIKGYTSESAIAVLTGPLQASREGYQRLTGPCRTKNELTESDKLECKELAAVIPYMLLGLDTLVKEGDAQAAYQMADHYAWLIPGAAKEVRPQYYAKFQSYAANGKEYSPAQIAELDSKLVRWMAVE